MSRSVTEQAVIMELRAIGKAATDYSRSIPFDDCDGTACLRIVSTAGSITVTQQCSIDDVTFFDPETSAGAAGAVEDTITVTTGRYLSFTPVMAPFTRFKVVEGNSAPTVVTLELVKRIEV